MKKQAPFKFRTLTKCIVTVVLASMILSSCSASEDKSKPLNQSPRPDTASIAKAHNNFGLEILKVLNKEAEGENVVISPTSIALALSMVYNGADGKTKDEMRKVLAFEGLDIDEINKASLALIESYKDTGSDFTLDVANSVWVQDGFDVKKEFVDDVEKNYNAKFQNIDFENEKAKDTINSWVKANTNDKIKSIVNDTQDLKLFLANATYFKGSWTEEFNEKFTSNRDFTNSDGTKSKIPTMSKVSELSYKETQDYQAVNLGYGKKARTSMYIFLPKDHDKFMNNMSHDSFEEMTEGFKETQIDLKLPKFTSEYEADLIPPLRSLGMKEAFTSRANFEGIAKKLAISSVTHKTFLDVNEEGTEAAAITGIGMITTSVPDYPTMSVDRPFVIAMVDSETGEIIFTGSIKNL